MLKRFGKSAERAAENAQNYENGEWKAKSCRLRLQEDVEMVKEG